MGIHPHPPIRNQRRSRSPTPHQSTAHTHTNEESRTRKDKVDKAGRVTRRYAGKLYHLGITRAYSGQKVTMVVVDKHITTALTDTGEILTEHVIDETRDYQKPTWKKHKK
ncbi:hypothetical protein GCM10009621_18450 [Corynebacterium felinum]|uniref:Transposase n=1 Tax=Corynebacterium felinum TaxID=131318 RepID=A0ABU2B5T9_9CORY|nr:hypothetical protein [Corynebacterium felinum]MDR7355030.1 hypothetical protein [Corynebacterium felinum]